MKKCFFIFTATLLLLTGCSQNKMQQTMVHNPYEIVIDNNTLSYYDTKENIPENFNILELSLANHQDINNNVLINSDNKIRCITIINNDIITYNQISVGDNINKIKDNFSYEYQMENNYLVIFDGNIEENPINENKEDNWIWINYFTDGSKITHIQIYDVKYGSEMK